jgi:hypothetical protein
MRTFLRLENEQKSCTIWVYSFLEIALNGNFWKEAGIFHKSSGLTPLSRILLKIDLFLNDRQ